MHSEACILQTWIWCFEQASTGTLETQLCRVPPTYHDICVGLPGIMYSTIIMILSTFIYRDEIHQANKSTVLSFDWHFSRKPVLLELKLIKQNLVNLCPILPNSWRRICFNFDLKDGFIPFFCNY
jgi:hypothetical protein